LSLIEDLGSCEQNSKNRVTEREQWQILEYFQGLGAFYLNYFARIDTNTDK